MGQDRRVKRTKGALEKAFLELLQQSRFQDITIHAICRRADYTRGAFYSHFTSKEDLVRQIIEHRVQALCSILTEPCLARRQLDADSLHAAALALFDHIYSHRIFYGLLKHPDFQLLLQDKLATMFIQHFLVDSSADAGHMNIEKELKAYHLAYATLGTIHCWLDQHFRFSSQYMAEELVSIATTPLIRVEQSSSGFKGALL